jgi:predicted oxidoreductase
MQKRRPGRQGLEVIGLGCMGMSQAYGVTDETESIATLNRAIELGVDFFDTADVYGNHRNEELAELSSRFVIESGSRPNLAVLCAWSNISFAQVRPQVFANPPMIASNNGRLKINLTASSGTFTIGDRQFLKGI